MPPHTQSLAQTNTHTLNPNEIHRLFPWHPLTLLPSDSVCTALRLCAAASLTHWDNVCICSYSQANPPPIIVNADSLDAGPYVSICSLSLSLYSIYLAHSHSLCVGAWACLCVRACVRECMRACVCVWIKRPPPGSNMLLAMWTDIHYPIDPVHLWGMCILQLHI